MKAAFIERPGPADSIHYGEQPHPALPERRVLVRMRAVTVNLVDTYIRSGAFPSPAPFPFIIGRDMTGVVEPVAPDVRPFQRGDRVWFNGLGMDGRQGTFAEHLSVPADRL